MIMAPGLMLWIRFHLAKCLAFPISFRGKILKLEKMSEAIHTFASSERFVIGTFISFTMTIIRNVATVRKSPSLIMTRL